MKPIKEADLLQAIEKYEHILTLFSGNDSAEKVTIDYDQLAHQIHASQNGFRKRFLISRREAFFKLDAKDIACFVFDARITYAITFDNQRFVINQAMDRRESELDPDMFFRANRQTIINMEAIDRFESYFNGQLAIKLKNNVGEKVLVSRIKASQFKDWLNR